MNLSEYSACDGLDLAGLVRRREVSAHELCLLALGAIGKTNPKLNAVLEVFAQRVPRFQFEPDPDAPFCGVPFLIKDFPTERGTLAEMGSKLARGFAPSHDSELMSAAAPRRLRESG